MDSQAAEYKRQIERKKSPASSFARGNKRASA